MLTASGSNFRDPPVNFYRAVQSKEPTALAQTVALTFMGTRADKWPKDRLTGIAAFFWQVGFKSTAEWKEEIVFFDPGKATNAPAAVFPDGTPATLSRIRSARGVRRLADHTQKSWFARNIVNRVWSWLLGRALYRNPTTSGRTTSRQSGTIGAAGTGVHRQRYDLKQVFRLILKSKTYQLPASKVQRSKLRSISLSTRTQAGSGSAD